MKKLHGIISPIATPFINDEIAFDKLRFNIERWNKISLGGYVVMGSNGESVFLTRNEKLKLAEAAKKFAQTDKLIIAGTGSDSIKDTILLTNEMSELGADYALILTPSFYKSEMKSSVFINYFLAVAEAVRIPVLIYNVPKFTGVDIGIEAVVKLSEHPNIVGIKNSTENIRQTIEFIVNTKKGFNVFVGTASLLFSGFVAGASGGIVAVANIAPNECTQIQKLVENGKLSEALNVQAKIIPINKAITINYGIAGLKAAMDTLGYFGGEPRAPLTSLSKVDLEKIKKILSETNLY